MMAHYISGRMNEKKFTSLARCGKSADPRRERGRPDGTGAEKDPWGGTALQSSEMIPGGKAEATRKPNAVLELPREYKCQTKTRSLATLPSRQIKLKRIYYPPAWSQGAIKDVPLGEEK